MIFRDFIYYIALCSKTPAGNLYSVLTMVEIKMAFHANVEYTAKKGPILPREKSCRKKPAILYLDLKWFTFLEFE